MRPSVLVALLVLGMASLAHASPPAGPESASHQGARRHFQAGVALLKDPEGARYEEAYREFKAAYALFPSPKILGNLAYAAMKVERDVEAILAYERYLAEANDIEAEERTQIESDLTTLKSGLVRVTVSLSAPVSELVDRRFPAASTPIENAYRTQETTATLMLHHGRHVLEARWASGESARWEFEALPGATLSHRFDRPVRAETSNPRVVPWTLTIVGGAALAAAATTGALALVKQHELARDCPNGVCGADYDLTSAKRSTDGLVLATDVLLVSGGVTAATGIAWLLFAKKSDMRERPAGAFRASPALGLGSVGAQVIGEF